MEGGFYLGQRVRFTQDYGPGLNKLGTVVCIRSHDMIGVEFDNPHGGHTCDGYSKDEQGWWCGPNNIKAADDNLYKIGDRLVPSESLKNDCGCNWHKAAYIKITSVGSGGDYYHYDVYDSSGDYIEYCSGHQDCFEEGMEHYKEPKPVDVAPEAPTQVYGQSGTAEIKAHNSSVTFTPPAPTARIGWMDEPVFIPAAQPVTSAKHSANLRKLIGHRNFKSRTQVS